tara:strand:- start:1810 stop:2127 length:318 start_codon:yes stop_codon:yes gene_type:complete
MTLYLILLLSVLLNSFLTWYVLKLLRKFYFVSDNLADLYLTLRSFQVFVKSMYSMDSYHGEPLIHELVMRIRSVSDEIEGFRDVFIHTLDEELEEELNAAEEEEN